MVFKFDTSQISPPKEGLELRNILKNILFRFPKTFDNRLLSGLDRLVANSSKNFISERSISHLTRLLVIQFFLQKRIETALEKKDFRMSTKFFYAEPSICLIALLPFPEQGELVAQDGLIKNIQTVLPGVSGVSGSFWRWLHPELPYMCFYIEIQRLRGKKIPVQEIRPLKHAFEEQLIPILPTRTFSLFLPFNEEEAYKQVQVLRRELLVSHDLPQVIIHFRQLTTYYLEFTVNLVRPASKHSVTVQATLLPPSIRFFLHFVYETDSPFPNEACCFSLFLPAHYFKEYNTVNFLQARACVVRYLDHMLGPFRDYNGGLFEAQREIFEKVTSFLADKIPHFSLFANKVFHAIQPIEARFSLSLQELEKIFRSIASTVSVPTFETYTSEGGDIWVFKTKQQSEIQPLVQQAKQKQLIYVDFEYASLYYFCVFDREKVHIIHFQKKNFALLIKKTTLNLAFLQGQPPSLSPYLTGGDVRCRALSKLLFEGLTRLDASGTPQLAAAREVRVSDDRRRYTFFLRSSKWSNGQHVTASDFLNGWKNVLSRKWTSNCPDFLFAIRNGKKFYKGLCSEQELGIYALDASTLQVDLEYVDPYFLEKLARPIFFPTFGNSQEPHAFNGPYRVIDYTQHTLELEINAFYWNMRKIFFQSIHIGFSSTPEEILTDFYKGEVDWVGEPFTPLPRALLQRLEQEGKLFKREVLRHYFLYLNTQYSLLRSPEVRQALSLSIDRAFICKNFFPHHNPLFSPVPMVDWPTIVEDSQQACELFENGLQRLSLDKNNLPTLVFNYVPLPEREELAEYLKQIWKETLNLSIVIQSQPWNGLRSRLEKNDFHIVGCHTGTLCNTPTDWLQGFEEKGSSLNFSGWSHADFRSIVSTIPHANGTEQCQLIEDAKSIFALQCPTIPVYSCSIIYAKHSQLQGEVFDREGCVDFSFSFLEE